MTTLSKSFKDKNKLQATEIIKSGDPARLRRELENIFQRDRLIILHDNNNSRMERNNFLELILTEFERNSHIESTLLIKNAQESINIAEEIFDSIKNSLALCDFSLNSSEHQFWGIIRRIDSEFKFIEEKIAESMAMKLKNCSYIDLTKPLAIHTPDGNFNPDEALSLIITTATLALKMLCHNNNYYQQNTVISPDFVEPTKDQIFQAGSINILAAAWYHIDEHSKSCLYFDSKITKALEDDLTVYYFEKSELAQYLDILSYVADIRLEAKLIQKTTLDNVPIEESIVKTFEEILCINILESTEEYNGLNLREIIGTYTAIQKYVRANEISESIKITKEKLSEILVLSGISSDKVDLSIEIIQFGKTSDDLFDSPLIKISEEEYFLITPAAKFLNPSRTTLSKIASLRHQVHSKGGNFEAHTLDFFKNADLQPIKIKFTDKNEIYEYDLVFEFEGYIFILECKNVSLPGRGTTGHLNYSEFIEETIEQVHRLNKGLVENKTLVKDRFKIDIDGKELVFVVLNNLPYCIPGLLNGIYVSDFVSFTKPIIQSSINLISKQNNKIIYVPIKNLRKNPDKLTPIDLVDNLNDPINFEFAKQKIMLQPYKTPIEEKTLIAYKIITTNK